MVPREAVLLMITLVAVAPSAVSGAVPVIDITDLYAPYQDPGDNFDLVTAYALPGIDLKAVILDPTTTFLGTRAPGQLAVEQLNLAFGRNVPYAYGPFAALSSPTDTLSMCRRTSRRASACCSTRLRRAASRSTSCRSGRPGPSPPPTTAIRP